VYLVLFGRVMLRSILTLLDYHSSVLITMQLLHPVATSGSIFLKITLAEVTEGGWIHFLLYLGTVLK